MQVLSRNPEDAIKNKEVIEIIRKQSYEKEDGEVITFTSAIDLDEAAFISSLIQQKQPETSIEIGCAEGGSSLTIMSALDTGNAKHTIVDPFQTTFWESKGINLLKKFRYSDFTLIEKGSEIALPALLEKGEKFDFAFVDGYHTFDHTLLDAFYLIRMLNVGGILVIDDVQMPAVNACVRYLYNYPGLKFLGSSSKRPVTVTRRLFDSIKAGVNFFAKVLPPRLRSELLHGSVLASDKKLGLRATMIAFQKTEEDKRDWNWWKSF